MIFFFFLPWARKALSLILLQAQDLIKQRILTSLLIDTTLPTVH